MVFNHLTVVQVSFCSLTKGITLKTCILCVCVIMNTCVIINNHSFEPFVCLDFFLPMFEGTLGSDMPVSFGLCEGLILWYLTCLYLFVCVKA